MITRSDSREASTRSITAIVGVAAVVLVSKLLGLGREMVVADKFGTSAEYDLYLIAVMLPALAYGVINFASYYLLVPHLTRLIEKAEPINAWRSIWGLFNRSILLSLAIAVLIILSAPHLMRIWAGQHLADEFARIVLFSRLTAIMVVLGTSEAYLRALLNTRKIFTWPAGGYIVENALFILSVLLLYPSFGVGAIVVGLLGGMLGQNIFLMARLMPFGAMREYQLSLASEHMQGMVSTITLLILIELLNRSYFLFDRYVAAELGVGVISSLNYSQVLVQLPDAVVGFAIASVVFPRFSQADLTKENNGFAGLYRNAIVGGMLLTIPLAVFFLVNAVDLVQVIFLRGRFDATSLELTASLLRPYTATIVALFVISTSLRAAYGQGWVKEVFWLALFALVTKVAATFLLPRYVGYPGITAATTLSQLLFAIGLFLLCMRRARIPHAAQFIWIICKLLIAGGISIFVGYFISGALVMAILGTTLGAALTRLAISGLTILAAFFGAALILGFGSYFALLFRRKHGS